MRSSHSSGRSGSPARPACFKVKPAPNEPTIRPAATYGLTERMEEIREALAKVDALAHKWQDEDAKATRKRKARAS